jgi:hypothetical protein
MDHSLDQLVNVSTLPGVTGYVYAMPDVHEGYGFPVGGVAAFKASEGIVSPGGVGYDINCGVRLLASDLRASACHDKIESLVHDLSRSIPSGMGRGGALPLSDTELWIAGWPVTTIYPRSRRTVASVPLIPVPSRFGPRTGDGINSARLAPATTSWKYRSWRKCSTSWRPPFSASARVS